MGNEDLRYPIGNFVEPTEYTDQVISELIKDIEIYPKLIRQKCESMSEKALDTAYRPGGWTGRQVIHHVADSHMNAYIRFKLSLTEDGPTIKPYDEASWAKLPDSALPIDSSLMILDALHLRWVDLLKQFKKEDFNKFYVHPETNSNWSMQKAMALYAWHGKHHLGHLNLID